MGKLLLAPLSSVLAHAVGSSVAPHAGGMLVHHSATTSPAQGSAVLRPAHAVHTWLPRVGALSPAHHSPVPSAPLPWVPWSWGDMAMQGTGADVKWERLANHTCGEEPLVPIITVAGGTWEVCPHSLQPSLPGDLPGGGHQSSGHILAVLAVGMKPDLPSSLPSAREVLCAGDVGAFPLQVPPAALAALPHSSRGRAGCKALPLFTAGVLQGRGEGGFY